MTPEELRDVQRFRALCEPVPLTRPDDPLYEPLDEGEPVRGSGGWSCIDAMAQAIGRSAPTQATCQIFTGFLGSGKTTELRRLAARLEADKLVPTHVVFVDFDQLVDRYTPISITDVLRVLAFALDRAASAEEAIARGQDPDEVEVGYLRRLFDFVARHDVEIKNLGFDVYGAKLMLEIKENANFRARVEEALKLRFQAFAEEARDMMREAIVRLRAATSTQRVVVIADGLEKLTHLRDEDREGVEMAAETVFATHASLLRIPAHVIYTFPFWLRFRATGLGALYDEEPRVLPMVKIADEDGHPHPPGVEKLVRLVGRRIKLERVFGRDLQRTLHPIIEASGGYPRDLLRMVRNLLGAVRALPATPEECAGVIDQLGETYEMVIRSTDLDLLVEIARSHALPLGDGAKLASFGRLAGNYLVLAYRNGREWYDVHPLVREARAVKQRLAAVE